LANQLPVRKYFIKDFVYQIVYDCFIQTPFGICQRYCGCKVEGSGKVSFKAFCIIQRVSKNEVKPYGKPVATTAVGSNADGAGVILRHKTTDIVMRIFTVGLFKPYRVDDLAF
jgi:hypothetical protein